MRLVTTATLAVALTLLDGAASARSPDETLCSDATAVSGDSLSCGGGVIRLHGITAMSPDTEPGEAARLALQRMVRFRQARCIIRDHVSDRLDIAVCYVNGRSLAERHVREGHARRIDRHPPSSASR